MYRPYTNHYPDAMALAGQVVGATLTAVAWANPLRTRVATPLFSVAVLATALIPSLIPAVFTLPEGVPLAYPLQAAALLATVAMLLQPSHALKVLAVLGQLLLFALSSYVRESDHELTLTYVFWYGLLLGSHLLTTAAPRRDFEPSDKRSYALTETLIFLSTVALAFLVTSTVFHRLITDGDEVAYTFQAEVYGRLKPYAPIPPCASMFENYWVFQHNGHEFSQYTPGWPLFMALFARLGLVDLASPVCAGLMAVGLSRLSRRLAGGLAPDDESAERIRAIAAVLGPLLAVLGPSMLLNAAARFSHVMVCLCFVWAVESVSVIAERKVSPRRALGYGVLLGASTALAVATRPADGAFLGVGVFLYFLSAAVRRQIPWRAWLGTSLGFAACAGLTLTILRLQLGAWFQTGYTIAPTIHPEAALRLSWPRAHEWKYGVPLAVSSYMWWPAAPALGIAGLLRALGGRERRVAFMLLVGPLIVLTFYFFVEFDRFSDDGLGPRYFLVHVIPMSAGGAALLAPLFARIWLGLERPISWLLRLTPALVATAAICYGVARIAPLIYPVAVAEYKYKTAPFRGAQKLGLKNAIVMIIPGHSTEHITNLAQNRPFEENPDVLFLIRRNKADEVCAEQHFPGRTWYRAGLDDHLTPY